MSVLDTPQTSIGAREILTVGGVSKTGFLRKEGALERLLRDSRIFNLFKWRQRFIVISRGCLYIYKDDYSGTSICAVSLKHYARCIRSEDTRMRYVFRVLPLDANQQKMFVFSCSTDDVRKEWMKALMEEMVKAHRLTRERIAEIEKNKSVNDEYVYLETQVVSSDTNAVSNPGAYKEPDVISPNKRSNYPPSQGKPTDGRKPRAPSPTADKTDKDSEQEYDEIGESYRIPTTQLKLNRTSFEFSSKDREEAQKKISQLGEGGYLVRKSRTGQTEVLSVKIDGEMKEFKIHEQGNKKTLDHNHYEPSVEALLEFYSHNNLPKRPVKLGKPYNMAGYVNTV